MVVSGENCICFIITDSVLLLLLLLTNDNDDDDGDVTCSCRFCLMSR